MKSYRDLDIYNESKRLAIEIHKLSLKLPKIEWYGEGSQIRRSSKAITALIVEGYGRKGTKQILSNIWSMLMQNTMKQLCIWTSCMKLDR